MHWLRVWLGGRRAVAVALALALALAAPSLGSGLVTEDLVHAEAVRSGAVRWPTHTNLFAYNSGDPSTIYGHKDEGRIPWIAYERFKISFWRPLASWTHVFDHRWLADRPVAMHAHSLAWLALVVVAVGIAFRRVLSPPVAGFATLLYAVDDAHGHAIGWLANRNALMATAFGVLAFAAHDRWRRDGWRLGVFFAPALLALGLLSSELAVGALGFIAAHVLVLDRARGRARWLAVVPCAAVLVLWAVAYRLLGHGTSGSGMYVDPLGEPVLFVRAAASRLPVLVAGLFGPLPAESFAYLPPAEQRSARVIVVVAIGVAIVAARRALSSESARFFALATLLSLLPACATLPADRLLFFPGIGAMALVAIIAQGAWSALRTTPGRPVALAPHVGLAALVAVAVALLGTHAVLAPIRAPRRVTTMESVGGALAELVSSALAGRSSPDQIVVLVNSPSFYFSALVFEAARGSVSHGRALFGGRGEITVTREDDTTLRVDAPQGFFTDPLDRLYRDYGHPMKVGDGLSLTQTLALVRAVNTRGDPTGVSYRFAGSLDAPRAHFVVCRSGRYEPFAIPPIGGSVTVPEALL